MDCRTHAGSSDLIRHYGDGSISKLVMNIFPEHHWLPWKFRVAPRYFWDAPCNRLRFMKYLDLFIITIIIYNFNAFFLNFMYLILNSLIFYLKYNYYFLTES